jgi:hypothetical protein
MSSQFPRKAVRSNNEGEGLEERLNKQPELKARIEELLSAVENAGGDLEKANDAEQRMIEELRKIGQTVLQAWATLQNEKQSESFNQEHSQVRQAGKKKLYWYSRFGRVEVLEQRYEVVGEGGKWEVIRPFQQSAEVHCRGYSMPLQRVITDFGADVAFGQGPQKLLEHHGVSVPVSSAQTITQAHAQKILEQESLETEYRAGASVETLIAEIDRSMIPIVTTDAPGIEGTR